MEAQKTSWGLFLRPYELGWWMWLIIATGLAVGIAGYLLGFLVAMGISLAKAVFIAFQYRSLRPTAAQVRVVASAMESCGGEQRQIAVAHIHRPAPMTSTPRDIPRRVSWRCLFDRGPAWNCYLPSSTHE